MQMYKITFIYQLGSQGWTETYYRAGDSARLASDLGGFHGLAPWLIFRPQAAVLQAIRAQEVDGLRRVFIRLHGFTGVYEDPDITSIAAVLFLPFAGRGSRHLWLRGLADRLVRRSTKGQDDPSARFWRDLTNLNTAIRELQLCGRRIVQSNPWGEALEAGPHEIDGLSYVRLRPGFEANAGQYLYFAGGPLLGIERERPFIVVNAEAEELVIAHQWPADLAAQKPLKRWKVRILEYEYPALQEATFAKFGRHSTSTAYKPASWVADSPQRTPLHPCGRIVDFIRGAYTTEMRFYRDDPGVTVPVKWYFPKGEPPAVPYEHPFASRSWELNWDYPPLIGEIWERTAYSGRPPIELNGIGLCGSRDAWQHGAGSAELLKPINPTTGQPCCCGPGVMVISGGAAAGPKPPPVEVRGGSAGGGQTITIACKWATAYDPVFGAIWTIPEGALGPPDALVAERVSSIPAEPFETGTVPMGRLSGFDLGELPTDLKITAIRFYSVLQATSLPSGLSVFDLQVSFRANDELVSVPYRIITGAGIVPVTLTFPVSSLFGVDSIQVGDVEDFAVDWSLYYEIFLVDDFRVRISVCQICFLITQ